MTALPPRELHLPDLPEVSVQIGGIEPGTQPRAQPALAYRLGQGLSSYLPLLLMAVLALSTAWLVRHTPQVPATAAVRALRESPDYTMQGFTVQRFGPDGRVLLNISGDVLHHFPGADRLEIEGVRIHAIAPDGRLTDAVAKRALINGDGSEAQLLGGARVVSQLEGGELLEVQGEFLHAFLRLEQLRSDQPVLVRRGSSQTRAGGLRYDHLTRELRLLGPVRSTLGPAGSRAAAAATVTVPASATRRPQEPS